MFGGLKDTLHIKLSSITKRLNYNHVEMDIADGKQILEEYLILMLRNMCTNCYICGNIDEQSHKLIINKVERQSELGSILSAQL